MGSEFLGRAWSEEEGQDIAEYALQVSYSRGIWV